MTLVVRKFVVVSVLVVLAVSALVLAIVAWQEPNALPRNRDYVRESHGAPIFDTADRRKVVGYATNVFVGRVIEHVSSKGLVTSISGETVPQTQFAVEVMENIKGGLPGIVTVNQSGGYAGGQLRISEGDGLLQAGARYLLITAKDAEAPEGQTWYQIVPTGLGHIQIDSPEERADLVATYEEAVQNQIVVATPPSSPLPFPTLQPDQ